MSLTTEVVFRSTDTSFTEDNFTLEVRDVATQTLLDPAGAWTLTHAQRGMYTLVVPNATVRSFYSLVHDSDPTIVADGIMEVPATEADQGSGDILFTWTEYQTGHQGDSNYIVPDVLVRVFTNDQAIGVPDAKGITDETGSVQFYLNEGTYYFFRRKSGRTFTNPVTVEVS